MDYERPGVAETDRFRAFEARSMSLPRGPVIEEVDVFVFRR